MRATPQTPRSTGSRRVAADTVRAERRSWVRSLIAGGTEGNERLTTLTGVILLILLAALGVTIVRIGQLLWLHLFLGLVLLGPVGLKLLSTGYRFALYYTSNAAYRLKGPPHPALRGLAPFVVILTLVVFGTGVALLILGQSSRNPLVLVHKVSFIAWLVVTALHVLGHLPELIKLGRPSRATRLGSDEGGAGEVGRWLSLASALALGLVLALALIPQFSAWTG